MRLVLLNSIIVLWIGRLVDIATSETRKRLTEKVGAKLGWMLLAGITFRLLSGLTTILMSYFLMPNAYAEFMTGVYWCLLITLISQAGLADLLVRQRLQITFATAQETLTQALVLVILVGLIVVVLVYGIVISARFSPEGHVFFALSALAAIITALNTVSQGAMRAEGWAILQARLLLATAVLVNFGLMGLAYIWGDIVVLGAWYLAAFLCLNIAHIFALVRLGLLKTYWPRLSSLSSLIRKTFKFGLVPILMMTLPTLAATQSLQLSGSAHAGSFALMIALFLAAAAVSLVLDQVFFPILTAKPDPQAAAAYVLVALFVSLPAVFIFGLNGPNLAHGVFSDQYARLEEIIPWLAVLIPVRFLGHALTVICRLHDQQWLAIKIYGASILALAIFGSLTTPLFGLIIAEGFAASLLIFMVGYHIVTDTLWAGALQLCGVMAATTLGAVLWGFLELNQAAGLFPLAVIYVITAYLIGFLPMLRSRFVPPENTAA